MCVNLLLDSADEDSLVAVITVYFDESGKLKDSAIVSFCGAIAFADEWIGFDHDWRSRLKDADLPYLKMANAMNWEGPFKHWKKDEPNREELRNAVLLGHGRVYMQSSSAP